MLKFIECEKLIKTKVEFDDGLNVVLGEDNAKNSIGKSSFLILIDYAFGGNSLETTYSEAINQIGKISLKITFKFGQDFFYFKRSTDSKLIEQVDINNQPIKKMSVSEYTNELAKLYSFPPIHTTFRSIVSLTSRIWNRGLSSPDNPLKISENENFNNVVDRVFDLYEFSSKMIEVTDNFKKIESDLKVINDSYKLNFVNKINLTDYKINKSKVNSLSTENIHLQDTLNAHFVSVTNIVNDAVLELKRRKDFYTSIKNETSNNIYRIEKNLSGTKYIKSKHFNSLLNFFPEVNTERLEKVEEFHHGVSKILKSQLEKELKLLRIDENDITSKIKDIDEEISTITSAPDAVKCVVDKLLENKNTISKLKEENDFYDSSKELRKSKKETKEQLISQRNNYLSKIESHLNDSLLTYNSFVYLERLAPSITFTNTNYYFNHNIDSGTGSSYVDLINFDLSLMTTTYLPFVIHDSMLFKNIEIDTLSKIIKIYNSLSNKQIFIAFDELNKFDKETNCIINKNITLKLSKDKPLFKSIWTTSE